MRVAGFKELRATDASRNPATAGSQWQGRCWTGEGRQGSVAEAKDIVGGFIVVGANDLVQATELSKGCPILEIGGSVEVRPVQVLNM